MINSRSLDELNPIVKAKVQTFLTMCDMENIDLLVTSTYRDKESQTALYNQGRTTPGNIVTNARAGESFHNYRCAVDIVPLVNGKPVWNTSGHDWEIWKRVGELGKEAGLEWAGDWESFKEFAHFQYTGGLSLKELQSGKTITE